MDDVARLAGRSGRCEGRGRIDASIIVPFIIFTGVLGFRPGSSFATSSEPVAAGMVGGYRFIIAAVAMALVAKWKGQSLKPDRGGLFAALVLGVTQFSVNFNSVYAAERFITSGVVATVFALLLIPNSLLAWAFLGQKPNRRFLLAGLVAVAGSPCYLCRDPLQPRGQRDIASAALQCWLIGLRSPSTAARKQPGLRCALRGDGDRASLCHRRILS